MLKKIGRFLAQQLQNPKKLILILHSFVAELDFKKLLSSELFGIVLFNLTAFILLITAGICLTFLVLFL